jgi:hypothetical protein
VKRGAVLLLTIVLTGVLLTLGVFLAGMVYNGERTVAWLVRREKAYWLAKAGSTVARVNLKRDPDWWGEENGALGAGGYRVSREPGKSAFIATGYLGEAVYTLEGEVK